MYGQHFYHGIIKKAVVAFGSLFNDIDIVRSDEQGTQIRKFKVPLSYIPKKEFYRLLVEKSKVDREDDNSPAGVGSFLPRMSFVVRNIDYDPSRKTNTLNKMYAQLPSGGVLSTYPRVPYKIHFELGIYTKKWEDGLQILEQILPYFGPSVTLSYRPLNNYANVIDNMIVNLEDVAPEFKDEGAFDDNLGIYIWTLTFSSSIYLYGLGSTVGLIRTVETTFIDGDFGLELSRIIVQVDPLDALPGSMTWGVSMGIECLVDTYQFNTSGIPNP